MTTHFLSGDTDAEAMLAALGMKSTEELFADIPAEVRSKLNLPRGRSELEMRTGQMNAAVQDAQKLVTVLPASPRDRLLLARAYAAVGNRPWVERTLWAAFQDIQADQQIYNALRSTKQGNADAMNDLQAEFERQREAKLSRGLL